MSRQYGGSRERGRFLGQTGQDILQDEAKRNPDVRTQTVTSVDEGTFAPNDIQERISGLKRRSISQQGVAKVFHYDSDEPLFDALKGEPVSKLIDGLSGGILNTIGKSKLGIESVSVRKSPNRRVLLQCPNCKRKDDVRRKEHRELVKAGKMKVPRQHDEYPVLTVLGEFTYRFGLRHQIGAYALYKKEEKHKPHEPAAAFQIGVTVTPATHGAINPGVIVITRVIIKSIFQTAPPVKVTQTVLPMDVVGGIS